LEVKAAGNAIDVKQFPRQVKAWTEAAFQGLKVDLPQVNATAGDKFLLKYPLAGDRIGIGGEAG
jgi:hypothetical protein